MKLEPNAFKRALCDGVTLVGLWVGLADANAAEALASCGFDWLLLDAEHAPNDPRSILAQLRAVASATCACVVRPVQGDVALIKQYLDIGARNLLIPMVDTAEQASQWVRAMRYPPEGVRGVGAALARASRWNQIEDYLLRANDEMCLLVQAETPRALANLEAIASVDGVDGVFFGPSDLAAAMGYRGQVSHPEVQAQILRGIKQVRASGKAAGVLATERALAWRYVDAGANFVAVGVDTSILVQGARQLASEYKTHAKPVAVPSADGVPSGGY